MRLKPIGQVQATVVVIALASVLMFATSASAEDVTLKSTDGLINLTGEFVDFSNETYVLRTPTGELLISARRVGCEGSACPAFDAVSMDWKITDLSAG